MADEPKYDHFRLSLRGRSGDAVLTFSKSAAATAEGVVDMAPDIEVLLDLDLLKELVAIGARSLSAVENWRKAKAANNEAAPVEPPSKGDLN